MRKIIYLTIILLLLVGCSELKTINAIREKYPDHIIYKIDSDEYILIKGEEIRYVDMDWETVFEADRVINEVIGYKEIL